MISSRCDNLYYRFRDNGEDLTVEILGHFTTWFPIEMKKSTSDPYLYLYNVNLKRGFKHRYHFMVNGEDMVNDQKKTMENKFGGQSNYLCIPLKKLDKKLSGDLSQFISQDWNYEDSIDLPVFVSRESSRLIRKRTTKEEKYLQSKVKNEVFKVNIDFHSLDNEQNREAKRTKTFT